jgi:hypothetical protein
MTLHSVFYEDSPEDRVPAVGETVFYKRPTITAGFVHTENGGADHVKCAACGEPFRGDPKANVCNTCAANGNYVNAQFVDRRQPPPLVLGDAFLVGERNPEYVWTFAARTEELRRDKKAACDQAVANLSAVRSEVRRVHTIDGVKDAFVERPPRDDTGYIDTTQLEQDVARILEAQGPDWYLQPDDPEPELSTHATMDQRFNAWMSVSLVGGFVLAALTISGVALKSGVLALVGLACMCLWVFVVMPKLEWLLVGRWEQTLSRSPAKR